jgi:putative flippase GtrA
MKFSKADIWKAIVAGEAIALLALPIFKNLKVFDLIEKWNGNLTVTFIALWLIFFPLATIFGLYVFYRISVLKWPTLFQLGKYGIVGWLNTFFTAGILNFLIWVSGISRGYWLDIFLVATFVLGMTNNFFWNRFWTFELERTYDIKREYKRFFAVCAVSALLNIGLMHLIVNIIGPPSGFDPKIWVNVAIAIVTPVFFLAGFFGFRIFVFNSKLK